MPELTGKLAVITGAASGIGKALAEHAAQLGMQLALADIEAEPLTQLADSLRQLGCTVTTHVVDVADPQAMDSFAENVLQQQGVPHLLFNNAGVGGGGTLWELEHRDWEWVIGVNLWGVINGIRVFTRHMVAQNAGHIVNTASIAGLISAPSTGPYTVSKHGVVALSETLYGELRNANSQVSVSVLCPSFVNTRIYAADRNRSNNAALDPAQQEQQQQMQAAVAAFFATALAPAAVAAQVFEAIALGRFYILTHRDSLAPIQQRLHNIVSDGVPDCPGPEAYPLQ